MRAGPLESASSSNPKGQRPWEGVAMGMEVNSRRRREEKGYGIVAYKRKNRANLHRRHSYAAGLRRHGVER